jgi:hypothetical protein
MPAEERPSRVTSTPLRGVESSQPVSPRPKRIPHVPTSQSITIYVEATGVHSYWGLQAVLTAWSAAKYVDLKEVKECPPTAPCVKVFEDKKIDPLDAATTDFVYPDNFVIHLNPAIKGSFEAQSATCHEVGHVIGMPHLKGISNSCMPAIGDFRTVPSKLDLSYADSLGHWSWQSAYDSAFKEVDIRTLPR